MKKLLQLSLLTYYKNWAMWLTIIGLEILYNTLNVYQTLDSYYLKAGDLNASRTAEAIKNFGVDFDCPITIVSYLLIAYMISSFYTNGIFKRFLFDGITRFELVFFQLLISILGPILITVVGFISTQVLLIIYLGLPSLSLITYIQWDLLLLSILGSFIVIQFFLLFINLFYSLVGLVIAAIIGIADPIGAGYTETVLKSDYYQYFLSRILNSVSSPLELPEISVLVTGLIITVLIIVSNALLIINKNL